MVFLQSSEVSVAVKDICHGRVRFYLAPGLHRIQREDALLVRFSSLLSFQSINRFNLFIR